MRMKKEEEREQSEWKKPFMFIYTMKDLCPLSLETLFCHDGNFSKPKILKSIFHLSFNALSK
jgi:hypothetical protein